MEDGKITPRALKIFSFGTPRRNDSYPTKSFCAFDANILKPLSDSYALNNAPKLAPGRSNRGRIMLNLDALKLNRRCAAAAFGALAIGTIAFSGSAAATPLQLFPFFMAPPAQWARRRCNQHRPKTKARWSRCRRG